MRILLLGITHPITQQLAQHLLHDDVQIITIAAEEYIKNEISAKIPNSNLQIILGDSSQNGSWQTQIKDQFDIIINASFPIQPVGRGFHASAEEERQTKIMRNLISLHSQRSIPLVQIIPINTYPPTGIHPFVSGTLSADAATGWGKAYVQSLRLSQSSFSKVHTLIYGQLLYNTAGEIYSTQLPAVGPLTIPIEDNQTSLTCTHAEDLIDSIKQAINDQDSYIQTVMQTDLLTQQKALQYFSKKNNKVLVPVTIPLSLASSILGEAATVWASAYSPSAHQSGYLKYPTLQAGLHLP